VILVVGSESAGSVSKRAREIKVQPFVLDTRDFAAAETIVSSELTTLCSVRCCSIRWLYDRSMWLVCRDEAVMKKRRNLEVEARLKIPGKAAGLASIGTDSLNSMDCLDREKAG
jgi:hypothetical protein